MAGVFPGTAKNCGSCEHWKGPRKLSANGKDALADRYEKGRCACPVAGAPHNSLKEPTRSCDSWAKWSSLS